MAQENGTRAFKKTDDNHHNGAMHRSPICDKNAAPPEKGRQKRSQGGVQFPTGGNCAQRA
ncbi:hypothetical protein EMIT0215P_170076 [Pseudomonas serboccidentalis]